MLKFLAAIVIPLGIGWHLWTDIVANPQNPRNLVVCGARWLPYSNTLASFAYVSDDGGAHWNVSLDDHATFWQSEQSCAFGKNSRVYFNSESSRPVDGLTLHELGQTHFYRSSDGGRTWHAPIVDTWFDHSAMAVGQNGLVYLFANSVIQGYNETLQNGPALKVSRDAGRSLGQMVQLPASARSDIISAFPSAVRVLRSGRVIAVMYATHKEATQNSLGYSLPGTDVVWTDDSGKTLRGPVRVADSAMCNISMPTMDVDHGTPQRIYVGFAAPQGSAEGDRRGQSQKCTAMFAYSNDGGLHWSAKAIPGSGNSTGTMLAVNNRGVLGTAWYQQSRQCWRFAYSRDGGRSFSKAVDLSSCGTFVRSDRNLANTLEATPVYYTPPNATQVQRVAGVFERLGMSVTAHTDVADWRSNMAASSDGAFHVAWPQIGTGRLEIAKLMVNTVSRAISMTKTAIKPSNDPIVVAPPLSTIPTWRGSLGMLTDITNALSFTFDNAGSYDYRKKIVTVTFQVANRGSLPLHGPFIWKISRLESDLGNPVGLNIPRGTLLNLSPFLQDGVLAPFSRSQPITIAVRINHYTMPREVEEIRVMALTSQAWAQP